MSDQWFYAQDNRQQGPVSFDEIRRLVGDGSLRPGDLVWTQTMANWQPAGGVPGLFPPAAVASGPPPVQAPGHPGSDLPPGYGPPPHGVSHGPVHVGYATPASHGYPPAGMGQDAGTRWLLPVGRSGWAIAAGYLGLLSVIPIFAPVALILSLVAISDIRRHPHRHGMGRAIFGLVMGVIFTLVLLAGLFAYAMRHS